MDSQVKERIVGAVVLVALGVWLIPWVLDGSDSSEAESDVLPEFVLPTTDEVLPLRTETVDLAPRTAAPLGADSEATPAGREPAPAAESPAAALADAALTDVGTEATGAPESDSPAPPAATVSSTPAPAAPPPAAIRPASGAAAGAWAVQVGAFGERPNAAQLADRVGDYGFAAQVSEYLSNGRTMHRVRVNGFATREQAEAVQSSLAAHGIPGTVMPSD